MILTEAEVGERAPALLAAWTSRWPTRRCVSLHALSEFARPLVTVALGGEGADELFGGYPRYRWIERARTGRVGAAAGASRRCGGLLRHTPGWGDAQRLLERSGAGDRCSSATSTG